MLLLKQTTVARSTQPTTYLEAKRLEAQKNYQLEQEYWKNNAEEIKRYIFYVLTDCHSYQRLTLSF